MKAPCQAPGKSVGAVDVVVIPGRHQSCETTAAVETNQRKGGQECIALRFSADLPVGQVDVGLEQFRTILQSLCNQIENRHARFCCR